jgi:hypothetical protein
VEGKNDGEDFFVPSFSGGAPLPGGMTHQPPRNDAPESRGPRAGRTSWTWLLLLALLGARPEEPPVVWVFFSPDAPDAGPIFRQLKGQRVRPVLLVERYFGTREPSDAFLASVKAAGDVRAFDEEGLRMARQWGVRRVPAVAVVAGDRVHLAAGSRVNVRELLQCSR